jgi:hypothetical protein
MRAPSPPKATPIEKKEKFGRGLRVLKMRPATAALARTRKEIPTDRCTRVLPSWSVASPRAAAP